MRARAWRLERMRSVDEVGVLKACQPGLAGMSMVRRRIRSAARREFFGRVQNCSGAKRPGRKAASLIFYLPTFVLRRGVASSKAIDTVRKASLEDRVEP